MSADSCFVCGAANSAVLEDHHIAPRRYGGGDHSENIATLCASCHAAIEELYDDAFYERLAETEGPVVERGEGSQTHYVDPGEAKERKIPSSTSDIEFEDWLTGYPISYIRDNLDDRIEGLEREGQPFFEVYIDEIEELYDEVLERERRRYEADPDTEEIPEIPFVKFYYEHDEMHEFPVLAIHNSFNCTPDVDLPTTHVSKRQRLHCAYCTAVFTDNEHHAAARHLRRRHGVEEPYNTGSGVDVGQMMSDVYSMGGGS